MLTMLIASNGPPTTDEKDIDIEKLVAFDPNDILNDLNKSVESIAEIEDYIGETPVLGTDGTPLNTITKTITEEQCSGNSTDFDCLLSYLTSSSSSGRPYSSYNHRIYYSLRTLLEVLKHVNATLLEEHASRTPDSGITAIEPQLANAVMDQFRKISSMFSGGLSFEEGGEYSALPQPEMDVLYNQEGEERWSASNETLMAGLLAELNK
eukprot:sb/3470311/